MANTQKPLQIFKPGRHTAMSGVALAFSESDLAASAAAYDPALFEAPLVVGHPKLDAPAYGWVKSVAFTDGALDAEPQQVDPAFAEMVSAGRFKKISAAFFSPTAPNNPVPGVYYLRHVGFLGAQAPAVKGLRTPEFAESEEGIVVFSEWDDVTNASLWRSMRDWVIGKFGQDEADKVIPGYQVQALEQAAQQEVAEAAAESVALPIPAFSEAAVLSADKGLRVVGKAGPEVVLPTAPKGDTGPSGHKEKSTVTPEQKAALEAENAQLKAKLADAEAATKTMQQKQLHEQNAAFADGLVGEGKLLPASVAVVVATMDLFATESPSFADGDTQKPLLEGFKGFLSGLPKQVEFAETATADRAASIPNGDGIEFAAPAGHAVDGERMALHRRAVAYQAEHAGMDYAAAVKAVS